MKAIEQVSEDVMVLSWAEAERDRIAGRGVNLAAAPTAEEARAGLAASRGYPDAIMFEGWPHDMAWSRMAATVSEIGEQFRHLSYHTFLAVTQGTRLPRDAATNIQSIFVGDGLNQIVPAIAAAVTEGRLMQPLIAVAEDEQGPPIIAEGNKRAIAYQLALAPTDEVEVLVASSPAISNWRFF